MAKPKYDYNGEEFLKSVGEMARKGFTDKEIAANLNLDASHFWVIKEKHPQITKVLTCARRKVTSVVRAKFLAMALGGVKTKNTTKRKIKDAEGNYTDEEEIQTTECELAPNINAMSTWLYHYDEDWRKIDNKEDLDEDMQSDGSISIDKWINDKTE